jgi:hypothetical protein
MELYELLINELYFQGVTIMNELRTIFYIDLIDPKLISIDIRDFNSAIFIYCSEEEKVSDKEIDKGGEDKDKHDTSTLLNYLVERGNRNKLYEINLREFMVKIFLTVVRKINLFKT